MISFPIDIRQNINLSDGGRSKVFVKITHRGGSDPTAFVRKTLLQPGPEIADKIKAIFEDSAKNTAAIRPRRISNRNKIKED